jgi:hypothetical protein
LEIQGTYIYIYIYYTAANFTSKAARPWITDQAVLPTNQACPGGDFLVQASQFERKGMFMYLYLQPIETT